MASVDRLGRSLDADRKPAAGGVGSPMPEVSAVLALQRTAGNRAVAAMVAATRSDSRRLARKPEDWAAKQAVRGVLTLAQGWNPFTTYWPPIQEATRKYAALREWDEVERRTALGALEQAIAEWEKHQENVREGETERQKKAALAALKELIKKEYAELGPPPAWPGLGLPGASPRTRTKADPAPSLHAGRGRSPRLETQPRKLKGARPEGIMEVPPDRRQPLPGEPFTPRTAQGLTDFFNRNLAPGTTLTVAQVKGLVRRALMLSGMTAWPYFPGGERGGKPPELPGTIKFFLHITREPYLQDIHEQGLRPGAKQGIGTPEGGSRDTQNLYVIDPTDKQAPVTITSVTADVQQSTVVFVVAATTPEPDPNYGGGGRGAALFGGPAPPVREAATRPGEHVFSFTLVAPAEPRPETGSAPRIGGGSSSRADSYEKSSDDEETVGVRYQPSPTRETKPWAGVFDFDDEESSGSG